LYPKLATEVVASIETGLKGMKLVASPIPSITTTVQSDVFMILELPGEELLTIVEVDLTEGKVVLYRQKKRVLQCQRDLYVC